jgi:4-carboxymuconolactone decarboxylase
MMSELDARYERGQETRRMFGGGAITNPGAMGAAWELAPDLERILGEALFGTIWHREALSPGQREMITLSTLVVLGREPQLRRHLGNALNIGLTPEQIVELIIHDTWYGGAPAGLNALALCKAVFEERGIAFTLPPSHDTQLPPDQLFERGNQFRMQYMGNQPATRPEPPTQAERDFGRITGEYYWGATWTRPGLDLPSRCLCTMTCLAALGRHSPLRSHIRGALNIGFTQDQIIEVFMHLTLYGGIPFAREAMDVANDIFING